jgi:very-short-patch-repair endonuclease
MTEAEMKLWHHMRAGRLGGHKFRKQHPIGSYIADFICLEQMLIVEADGAQHADSAHDARRDAFLAAKGYRVLRFWNNEISMNIEGVKEAIYHALMTPHPPTALRRAPPSPARGEGHLEDGASLG